MTTIKALTLHNPYGPLIVAGAKVYETRGWQTDYRGPIAIHAGKSDEYLTPFLEAFWDMHTYHRALYQRSRNTFVYECAEALRRFYMGYPAYEMFAHGAVIGIGILVAIHRCEDLQLTSRERLFGHHAPGRFAWEIRHVYRINPIPARGQQILWDWTRPEVLR